MSQDHRLQQQRFELKYLVPEGLTQAIRDFTSCYLELDDYSVGKPDYSYDIHSVYLDSPALDTHHATINGDKNRFKLRLRYYDGHPNSPVFFEIKRRVNDCILKSRCGVRREAVPLLLSGQMPEPDHLISREARHFASLHRFIELQQLLKARPRLHNNYKREAWVSTHDNSIRVTFDRRICIEPHFDNEAAGFMRRPRQIYPEAVVLELKFTNRFPNWFRALVERFNLMRSTASKYCGGIEFVGREHFETRRRHDSALSPVDFHTDGLNRGAMAAAEVAAAAVAELSTPVLIPT